MWWCMSKVVFIYLPSSKRFKFGNMEIFFLIIYAICISALLKAFFDNFINMKPKFNHKLPPGPLSLPIITTLWNLHKLSSSQFKPWLRSLQAKFGPIITLHIGPQPHIFVFSRALAHQALVQNGPLFADRPKPSSASVILYHNQHNISTAGYGPTWRLFRRNLEAAILQPSRLSSYRHARETALELLISRLRAAASGHAVNVAEQIRRSMFKLLATMCLGDDIDEEKMKEIEEKERSFLLALNRFRVLDLWPRLTKILLPNRWAELLEMKRIQVELFIPFIRARKETKKKVEEDQYPQNTQPDVRLGNIVKHYINSTYLDSLLELEVQEENTEGKRKLSDLEIISLCSEFLNAGVDTTSTSLQWIMANLVKYPEIQTKVFEEIRDILGLEVKEVKEEDIEKLPYLRAVVVEGLRRHPPGHLLLPHGVLKDAELEGYLVPKNAIVHFVAAEMGWDPQVWDCPMEFWPERFLGKEGEERFDVIKGKGGGCGGGEIKMMPFGGGRRMCPGYNLGMLHLMYFLANLIWNFEFKAVNGAQIDLSEKLEFTTVMKYPLIAQISPRSY